MVRYIYKSVSETGALMGKELGEVHYSPVVRQELTRPFQDSHAFLTATICPDSWTKVQAEPSPSPTAARVFFLSTCPSAGHMAKVKMLISAEPRPSTSLRSLPVNRLQEGPYAGGVPPHPAPSASGE